MSNINPQALFRKYPFLAKYYDVNKIHQVKVVCPGADILEVRRWIYNSYWTEKHVPYNAHQILFLDDHGEEVYSIGYHRKSKPKSFLARLFKKHMPESPRAIPGKEPDLVGEALFKLGDHMHRVAYIVLFIRVTVWPPGCEHTFNNPEANFLTLCKPPLGKTLKQYLDELIDMAVTKIDPSEEQLNLKGVV